MTVTAVDTDYETLTLTLVAEFDAPVARVWELWNDPRQLERWWGPPMYPATVEEHNLEVGGSVTYFMTGPEGDIHRGYWDIVAVSPAESLEFVDGFADENGVASGELPTTRTRVEFAETATGTRMTSRATFVDREQMDQLVAMGMVEGLTEAAGQMDALLAERI